MVNLNCPRNLRNSAPSCELGEQHHSLRFFAEVPDSFALFSNPNLPFRLSGIFSVEALCTLGWQQAREKNKTAADLSNNWSKFNGSYRGGCPRQWTMSRLINKTRALVDRWFGVFRGEMVFSPADIILYGEGGGLSGGGGHFHR